MKFKAILGAAVVLGTMMCASVTAHAATFKAGTATTKSTSGFYEVPITVAGDSATETLNGYIIKVTYDPSKVTMEQADTASDNYAKADAFCSSDGVFVSDVFKGSDSKQTGEGVVAWATGTAKTIGTSDAALATLAFDVVEGFEGTADVKIELTQLSYTGTDLLTDVAGTPGAVTVGATITLGDVDGDGDITTSDAALTLQGALKIITLTESQNQVANVDNDEEVTTSDAALILQRALKIITAFPKEAN